MNGQAIEAVERLAALLEEQRQVLERIEAILDNE